MSADIIDADTGLNDLANPCLNSSSVENFHTFDAGRDRLNGIQKALVLSLGLNASLGIFSKCPNVPLKYRLLIISLIMVLLPPLVVIVTPPPPPSPSHFWALTP